MRLRTLTRLIGLAALTFVGLGGMAARAESVLTVAMTAADIPDDTGAPDQGYEGYRFVGYTLYDSLVEWDLSHSDKVAEITPGLATDWAVDPKNNTRWILHLRKGVKFHDGCPFNADTVTWNFARVMDPKAPQFNARHAAFQGAAIINIASVDKVDDDTVAINTKGPDSLLPYDIAEFFMISPCRLKADGYDYTKFMNNPSGTGPYKFTSLVPHQRLELVANKDYWNPKRVPKQDRLVLLPMPEASTRAAALLSGQVNFVEAPSPDTIPQLKAAGMQIITVPYPHNWDYQVRLDEKPFSDIRVRQAANYAINRDEIVEFLQGIATPAYERLISTQPWYGNPTKYEYNPDKAKELLKEAGCVPCEFKVAISTSGSGQMQPLPMNELVKEQLEAVGFKVDLVPMDWNALIGVWLGGAKKSGFDAMNFSLAPIDPVQGILKMNMTKYQSPNGSNWGNYSNPQVDEWGNEALAEFDPVKRNALLTKINEQSTKDAGEIFIVHDLNPRALSPKLHGFVQAQSWFQDLTPITVEP
ncbi:MAG TPA: ABC transporter substrate-binding protein [Devosiaceae bacterium]|nr:ABC transporter substrate-binding protein [Devosiaceae bacterium]